MARHSGGFRLHGLCTSYLQSFGSGIRVKRHILRFEGSRPVSVLPENAAKGSGYNALAHIATGSGKHQRVKFFHLSS